VAHHLKGIRTFLLRILICTITTALATSSVAAQVPFEVVHSFEHQTSPGPNGIIQAADGNLYGTTYSGGAFGVGTAFKMTPSGVVTTLHDFADSPDGAKPDSALIQASDGNFYGTTYEGGMGCGTVFKMTAAGTVTVLHSFVILTPGYESPEGCHPAAQLIQASDGNLHGSASSGGTSAGTQSAGALFKIALDGTFEILHTFSFRADGGGPEATLVQAADGNFYGTTSSGGPYWNGTIFKMAPDGTITVLHACGIGDDGAPSAMVQGPDGSFYGTMQLSGSGEGEVFK
jgi:uncharacterized repeat protein (TIGR03803 family)